MNKKLTPAELHALLNVTGVIGRKLREHMEDVANEVINQIDAALNRGTGAPSWNSILELAQLAQRAARHGVEDGDYKSALILALEQLEDGNPRGAKEILEKALGVTRP